MHTFKMVLWQLALVALGVALATVEVGGKTALQHASSAWRASRPVVDKVKAGASAVVRDVKDRLDGDEAPREHHSQADRDAVEKLIARRKDR